MEEFLRSGAPQIRRNALTALAVVGEDESTRLIARAAIEDEDPGVRRRAREESLSVGWKSLSVVREVFLEALASTEFQKQQRAYAMLGRLKSNGIRIPPRHLPWGSRMRLAGSMSSYLYPVRNLSFRLRSWQPGLLGTMIGLVPFIVFMVVYLARHGESKSSFAAALGLSSLAVLMVGAVSAVFATQFTTPISLQLRPFAATLVELLATLVSITVGGLVFVMLLVFLMDIARFDIGGFRVVATFVPLVATLAAVVRLGTILATRGRFNFIKGPRTSTWLVELGAGAVAGFLFATPIYLLLLRDASPYDWDLFKGLWLASLAVAFGLAISFAKIDSEASSGD
jgi:hypothetical protein